MDALYTQAQRLIARIRFFVIALALITPATTPGVAQEQTLSDRALDNLVAFTRLLGYVRYFHPADTVADADWDAFAIANIEAVEDAKTRDELVTRLNNLFVPYAPTVQVFITSESPDPTISEFPEDIDHLYVTQWVHIPSSDVTISNGAIIPSRRPSERVMDGSLPQSTVVWHNNSAAQVDMHNPLEPFVVELGSGISASIPLALFADSAGTLPHIEGPAFEPSRSADGNNRATHLATVAVVWNHFQHLFSYWNVLDALDVDWEAALREALVDASNPGIGEDDFIRILRRMTAYLRDGHSYIMPHPACKYLPPVMFDVVEGELVVTHIIEPDEAGEIALGDIVLEWDGRPISELLEEGASITAAPTEQFGTYRYIFRDMMCGETQGAIALTLRPYGSAESYTATIERTLKTSEYPTMLREPRPPAVASLSDGIVYIDLTRIDETSYQKSVPFLAEAEGIVIDVRGYPNYVSNSFFGHLTDEPLSSAPFLVPVVTTPDHMAIDFVDVTYDFILASAPRFTDNIVFITNGNGTASYSESLMAIVEGYELAPIVGQPTAGTNGDVAIIDLPGEIRIYWTSLHVTKFDGSPLYTVGVTPTVPVERTLDGVVAGRDELLEAAFERVGGDRLNIEAIDLSD